MSKKLAEDITGLVLDVKFGSGAFMKTLEQAEKLATLLKNTGEINGVDVRVVFSNMDQPLGRFIGNGLEIKECLDILNNNNFVEDDHDYYANTRDLSLILAGYMIHLGGKASCPENGLDIANALLDSGKAFEKFAELAFRQGCKQLVPDTSAKHKFAVIAAHSGTVCRMDCEKIGFSAIHLGAGRVFSSDKVDHSAGIEINCFLGQKVKKGHVLAYLYTNNPQVLESVSNEVLSSIKIDANIENYLPPPLIAKVI